MYWGIVILNKGEGVNENRNGITSRSVNEKGKQRGGVRLFDR